MDYVKMSNEDEIKNVVIYTRVSSADQVEGFSLETQREDLLRYIDYKKFNLVAEFQDRGISAKDIDNRTDYKRMMKYISQNSESKEKVDAIIVWKLSRFSRNSLDLQQALKDLEEQNCHLIAEKDGLNTFNDMNKVILKLLGIFAELERTNIANNVRSGMKKGAQEGHWMGGKAPFGYESLPKKNSDDSTLNINEDEAIVIRKIFKLYSEGNGLAKIADYLNNKALIKTRQKNYWTFNGLSQILDNPVYVGQIRYGKFSDWNKKGRQGKVSPDKILYSEGKHEAIIDMNIWDKVRKIREERGFRPEKTRVTTHLLSGKVLCPVCQTPMVSTTTSAKRKDGTVKYNYYYQCGQYNNSKTCKPNLVQKEFLDEQAKRFLFEFAKNPKLQDLILNKLNKSIDFSDEEINIERAQKELITLERKLKNSYYLLIDEDPKNQISKDRIKSSISKFEEEVDKFKEAIKTSQDKIFVIKNEAKVAKDIRKLLENLEDFFELASYEKQKNVMSYLIKSITVNNDTDIKKRSTIDKITLQFSSEEIATLNFDTLNNVWFTCDTVRFSGS